METIAIYRSAHQRIVELVEPLAPDALDRTVPGTPAWSAHDLLAHLAGVATDMRQGNLDGVATDPWTAAQVGKRRHHSLGDLLVEWEESAPAVEAVLVEHPDFHPLAVDVLVHEHDLRGATGQAGSSDADAVNLMIQGAATMALGRRLDQAGRPALRLVDEPSAWVAGTAEPGAAVRAPAVELFRALFGRRSEAQIRAYAWEGDPTPYLDVFNLFGVLPADDVDEAGAARGR